MKQSIFKRELTPEERLRCLSKEKQLQLGNIVVEVEKRLVIVKTSIYEIGAYLCKAKEILTHGMFKPWIEQTFDRELPYSTAALYMKIFTTFAGKPKLVQHLPVTFLMSMTQKQFPDIIFQAIVENENVDKLDVQVLNEAYQDYKADRINLDKFMSLTQKQIELTATMEMGRTQRRMDRNFSTAPKLAMGEILSTIKKVRQRMFGHGDLFPDSRERIAGEIDACIKELTEIKDHLEKGDEMLKYTYHMVTGIRTMEIPYAKV